MKWTLLMTAPDQLTAEMWRGLLADHDIPARLMPGDTSTFLGVSSRPCGILVEEVRLEEAKRVMEGESVS